MAACAAMALVGCGRAKTAEADDTANTLVKLVNSGDCSDTTGVPETAASKWPALCADIRKRMKQGTTLPSPLTDAQDSGEIGKAYNSRVVFQNKLGVDETLMFLFQGTGVAANNPEFRSASSVVKFSAGTEKSFAYEAEAWPPSPDEKVLLETIYQTLNDGNCDELATLVDPGLPAAEIDAFVATCRGIDRLIGSETIEMRTDSPVFSTYTDADLYVAASTDVVVNGVVRIAGEEPSAYASRVRTESADTHKLLGIGAPDLGITLLLSDGKWYLNGLAFARVSFTYMFP
jgi:hypothetical protein